MLLSIKNGLIQIKLNVYKSPYTGLCLYKTFLYLFIF